MVHADSPLLALGMASLVLGLIGMLLFFLPILGIPISACGVICGVLGFIVALFTGGQSLRWSVGGFTVSALALGVNLLLNYTPEGFIPGPVTTRPWQEPRDRPFVAPPAN
jgi:hypothetical protein